MSQQEYLKTYKTPEETLQVWAKQLNHLFGFLNNNGYVTVTLTASDVGAVPTSRTVNSKALNVNITLSASDVGAVPDTRTVNSKQLNTNITLNASDVGAVPDTRTVNDKQLNANITLSASDVGAAPDNILSTGISQSMTIPDIDGINYHHFTFTNGILTAYLKDTNP